MAGGRSTTIPTANTPPLVELIRLPGHERVKLFTDNAALKKKLAELEPVKTEFFRVDIGDGVTLDGWCMLPPHFDPRAKYPLLVHVYGEPAGQTVLDRWGGGNQLWHRMLAEQGYVVMSFDNRGTPAPKGRAWRKAVYPQDRHPGAAGAGRRGEGRAEAAALSRPEAGRRLGMERRRAR